MMRMRARSLDERAVLTGFDAAGQVAFDESLDLAVYWRELHPVLDEREFRRQRKIQKLVGKLYGPSGELLQQFVNTYAVDGSLESSYCRHEDGTETRFP